jgi:hypothetical protein
MSQHSWVDDPARPEDRASRRRVALRALMRSALINMGIPLILFFVLRQRTHSDAAALAIAGCVPTARFLLSLLRRRPVEPLAVISAGSHGIALLAFAITGGSPIALELHEPVISGGLGLAGLIAFVCGLRAEHVLARIAPGLVASHHGLPTMSGAQPGRGNRANVAVLIISVTLLVRATVALILAFNVSLVRFVVLERVIGLPIAALGGLITAIYLYRTRPHA